MGIFDFIFSKKNPIIQEESNKNYRNYNKGYSGTGKIYLNVPYSEKDQVKEMGARWDPDIKKWYYKGLVRDYIKFAKWISDDEEITIAFEHIYMVERIRTCYKCGKQTRVIGLALGEHMILHQDDGTYKCDYFEDIYEIPSLYVTWELCERDIPPALLEYLKSNYNIHIGKSRIGGTYFANHCAASVRLLRRSPLCMRLPPTGRWLLSVFAPIRSRATASCSCHILSPSGSTICAIGRVLWSSTRQLSRL